MTVANVTAHVRNLVQSDVHYLYRSDKDNV